jgi:hypothetical protein
MFPFKKQAYDNNIYLKWIFYIYCALMLNLGLLLLNLPFFVAANFLALSYPNLGILLLLTLPFYPAIIAIFAVMDKYDKQGHIAPFKDFLTQGIRRFGLTGLGYGSVTTLVLTVLISDMMLFYHLPLAQLSLPFLGLVSLLVLALALNMLYFRVRNPQAQARDVLRLAIYCLLRKWYVSLLNVLLLFAMFAVMFVKPQFGFIITPALFLGIIFLNCRKLYVMMKGSRCETLPQNR